LGGLGWRPSGHHAGPSRNRQNHCSDPLLPAHPVAEVQEHAYAIVRTIAGEQPHYILSFGKVERKN
jgi:hypothetical protein